MTPLPTLVLVHGAWHGPWAWDPLVTELDGVAVHRIALPSAGPDPATLGDMSADADVIRSEVAAIDGPVVICGHSYGAIPVTEVAAELRNVVGLVYLCAFQFDVGDSITGAPGRSTPDWWDVHEAEGYVDALRPHEIFYGGVDGEAVQSATARMCHQGLAALGQPQTRAAWRTVPSTYVVCEQDRAIPVPAQEAMARRSKRVVRMAAAHSPFLSHPAELAQILRAELEAAPVGVLEA